VSNDPNSPAGVLDVPAATTAVLHGMMATLSEVLGGIDGRIAALEQQLRASRAESGSPRALAEAVEAAVARLGERLEALEAAVTRPAADPGLDAALDSLRHSIDALAVRPVRDDALHDAVARLAELVAEPPPPPPPPPAPPPPDDVVRDGVTSLHERLSVLLEMASQPAQPDDAVRTGLVEVQQAVAGLTQQLGGLTQHMAGLTQQMAEQAAAPPTPEPVLLDMAERLRQLDDRSAAAAAGDEEASTALRLALNRLSDLAAGLDRLPEAVSAAIPPPPPPPDPPPPVEIPDVAALLAPVAADVAAVHAALANHPAAALVDSMARVEQQVASLVAQPGPGPAMAMVAAGLAERFEARTDTLVDLLTTMAGRISETAEGQAGIVAKLDAAATVPGELAARVEEFVGGQFAELSHREDAVAAALGDVRDALASTEREDAVLAVLERVRGVVEGEQGEVAALREGMRALYEAVERHGAVSGQVGGLLAENRAALAGEVDRLQDALAGQNEDLAERVRAALEAAANADAHAAEMGANVSKRIDEATGRLVADVQALVATGQDPARLDALAERISESVHRESELLTQRVAALSVALDGLRAMLDDLVEETSNSIGRKATEVGRKLAADLGIRGKKPGAGSGVGGSGGSGKAKERSIGPGSS
jgi:ABC-type transporter Mla subunit MlaD